MLVEDPMNKRLVLISRLLLSVQPQLSGEMNDNLSRLLVGKSTARQ